MQAIGQSSANSSDFNLEAFASVAFGPVVTSLLLLLDSNRLHKDLHVTGIKLLRKIVEVENKHLVTPAADWDTEDWD